MTAYLGPERKRRGDKLNAKRKLTAEQQALVLSVQAWCRLQAMRWAKKIAWANAVNGYRKQVFEDLYSGAILGAATAALKFDKSLGFTFLTYASHYIRQSMQTAARGLAPVGDSFADFHGLPRGGAVRTMSLHSCHEHRDGVIETVGDMLEFADREPEQHDRTAVWEKLEEVMPNSRDAEIVRMLFEQSATLEEVGRAYSLSKERVRQIRQRALVLLRDEEEAIR